MRNLESEGIKRRNANLIPFNKMSPERKREIQSMGGKKAREVIQKKKTFKEYLEMALALEDDEGTDKYTKIVKALINEAEDGNVKAFETIRDTMGQKPKDEVEQKQEIKVVMEENISKWGS